MSDRANYIASPPALFHLRLFGDIVHRLIGERAYLVGSVLYRRDHRDVDVRIMLDDTTFARVFGEDSLWVTNGSLTLANMALSALAKQISGLEVDCQIERSSDANIEFGNQQRQPLMFPPTMPFVPVDREEGP